VADTCAARCRFLFPFALILLSSSGTPVCLTATVAPLDEVERFLAEIESVRKDALLKKKAATSRRTPKETGDRHQFVGRGRHAPNGCR